MHHRVHFADIGEELVAEAFALGRAAHKARDINKRDARRNDLGRFGDGGQLLDTRIGHGHVADIRLDGAERIIRRLRRRGLRQRVEECRFADVRQADDAAFETHYSSLSFFFGAAALGVFGAFGRGGFSASVILFMKPMSLSFASNGAASAMAVSIGTSHSFSSALVKLPSTWPCTRSRPPGWPMPIRTRR